MNKRINLNDPAAWSEFDWSEPVVPEVLKKTDGQVARARGVRLNKDKISKGLIESYQQPGRLENQQKAMQTRDNTAHKNAGKKRAADPEWKTKQKSAIEALHNDPVRLAEYKKNYAKGNSKKYDNPEYWENYYAGIAKRDADEEYTKKRLDASRAKICKKVHTPLGVFDSITEASKAYGMGNSETMRHRIKSPNFPDFYIVEK